MNSKHILAAMNNIRNDHILSAQKKLGYDPDMHAMSVPSSRKRRTLRRTIALIAAVIMLMSVCFTTALAANPEFREMVFTFFGISQPEIVPDLDPVDESNPGNMAVEEERTDIGGVIEATYVHYPVQSIARNGIFLLCTDEQMMNTGNHYDAYREENGELIQLEEHTFSQDYSILGNNVHVEFEWVEHNGNVSYTYVDPEATFRKPNLAGDVTATLMTIDIDLPGDLGSTNYPVLINIRTGELTDICAGTGVESIPDLYQAAISEDLTKMLLVDWNRNLYYVDLTAKQLYRVDELAGEHVQECSLIGDKLACFVLEGDSIEEGKIGTYRAWTIDLTTMERTEIFSGLSATASTSIDVWSNAYDVPPEIWAQIGGGIELEPLSVAGLHFIQGFDMTSNWGNMYAGSKFAVEVDLGRNVYVIDLATGERTIIDGFRWPDLEYPRVQCAPSADGEKLLIYTSTYEGYFGSIGILDFTKKNYTEFSRENLNDVNEHTIYWFDNDSIIIAAVYQGETDYENGIKDYYVYRLLDGGV